MKSSWLINDYMGTTSRNPASLINIDRFHIWHHDFPKGRLVNLNSKVNHRKPWFWCDVNKGPPIELFKPVLIKHCGNMTLDPERTAIRITLSCLCSFANEAKSLNRYPLYIDGTHFIDISCGWIKESRHRQTTYDKR